PADPRRDVDASGVARGVGGRLARRVVGRVHRAHSMGSRFGPIGARAASTKRSRHEAQSGSRRYSRDVGDETRCCRFVWAALRGRLPAACPRSPRRWRAAGARRYTRQRPAGAGPVADAGRVLVVDDDAAVREMLTEYLASHGYEVGSADSGQAMRAEIERSPPDVILLDVQLPGEDGLTLARYLRERYDVGIIMVTGATDPV